MPTPDDTRLIALDRAVQLVATGRIEPDDVIEFAGTFHDYLTPTDSGSDSLDDVLLRLTRIEINYEDDSEHFMVEATAGIGVTFSDDGQTLTFTVR